MRIVRLRLRDFRSYSSADVRVGPGMTVVHGRNGAGKTNLLEALYVGCTGASWRTASDRELVRFGADVARGARGGGRGRPPRLQRRARAWGAQAAARRRCGGGPPRRRGGAPACGRLP